MGIIIPLLPIIPIPIRLLAAYLFFPDAKS